MLYPLSYEGGGCRKHGRKPGAVLGLGRCSVHLGRPTASVRRRDGSWLRGCAGSGASKRSRDRRWAGSGGEGGGLSSPVVVEREAVDHEGVAEQVHELAFVAEAVGAAEPEGVVEGAVDALGVVAARVEPVEVGVGRRRWVGRSRSG